MEKYMVIEPSGEIWWIEIQPIRYLVTLHSKPLGMCIRSGDKWVFYCSIDGSITSGSTPEEATTNNVAVRERCQKEIRQDYHRIKYGHLIED